MTKKDNQACLFCSIIKDHENKIIIESMYSYAIYDDYPVTLHHCLIIPKRHIKDFFDLTDSEILDIYFLIKRCKTTILSIDGSVRGFNIGINIGKTAGQSIFHVHIHLIPRRVGDTENPKGGVRALIPGKQNY